MACTTSSTSATSSWTSGSAARRRPRRGRARGPRPRRRRRRRPARLRAAAARAGDRAAASRMAVRRAAAAAGDPRRLGATSRPAPWSGSAEALDDRLHGAWLGRCAGCVMGKPVEGLDRAAIERYLRAAGQWPQTGYIPPLDPLPEGVGGCIRRRRRRSRGAVRGMSARRRPRLHDARPARAGDLRPRLHRGGRRGRVARPAAVHQAYTAERAAYRNLVVARPAGHGGAARQPVPRVDRRADPSRRVRLRRARAILRRAVALAIDGRRALAHRQRHLRRDVGRRARRRRVHRGRRGEALDVARASSPPARARRGARPRRRAARRRGATGTRRATGSTAGRPLPVGAHDQQRRRHRRRAAVGRGRLHAHVGSPCRAAGTRTPTAPPSAPSSARCTARPRCRSRCPRRSTTRSEARSATTTARRSPRWRSAR